MINGLTRISLNSRRYIRELMQLYIFIWNNERDKIGNITKRKELYGRTCKILTKGKMRSILVEFIDNGQKEVVDLWSIKKVV